MADRSKKIIAQITVMPQITLLLSQFLFLTVLASGFSLISGASLTTYERALSPLYTEGSVSALYD
tara:strand:+ start:699 stop:893 length:195 start_codon:yes stop_codon:yes gene_type:complete